MTFSRTKVIVTSAKTLDSVAETGWDGILSSTARLSACVVRVVCRSRTAFVYFLLFFCSPCQLPNRIFRHQLPLDSP